jgi:predicted Zn finger-like uncharacterized protein
VLRFQCPVCKTVMQAPDDKIGKKVACPKCGQRLQIPAPPRGTVLATPLPTQEVPNRQQQPPPQIQGISQPPKPVLPDSDPELIPVPCPGCGRVILLPPNELSWTIECSRCGRRFVPRPPSSPPPALLPVEESPVAALPYTARSSGRENRAGAKRRIPQSTFFPTVVAVISFLSLCFLFGCAVMARGPHWDGDERTYSSYQQFAQSYQELDQSLGPGPIRVGTIAAAGFFVSGLFTLVTTITSLCLWPRHNLFGRVLTILTCVLVMPCSCCGLL